MIEIITLIFSVCIASFIIGKHFSYKKIDNRFKIEIRDYFKLSFIICLCSYMGIIVGVVLDDYLIVNLFVIIIGVILFKALIISIIKINYYDKKYKIILKENDYNINKIDLKKEMAIDAIKNIFYILASPFLVLEFGIKFILRYIF